MAKAKSGNKRIGIFGGTFNPVHLGHLKIAQVVLERLNLDKIIFVPCFYPPHKIERKLAKPEDRLKMVSLAIKGNPDFQVSGWEIKHRRISYTIDTLKFLRNKIGKDAWLYFIIGSDNLKQIKKWKDIKGVLKLTKMVVVNRPGSAVSNLPGGFAKVNLPGINISSSLIRRYIALKREVGCFLPDKVLAYINRKRIYS